MAAPLAKQGRSAVPDDESSITNAGSSRERWGFSPPSAPIRRQSPSYFSGLPVAVACVPRKPLESVSNGPRSPFNDDIDQALPSYLLAVRANLLD